MKMHPERAGPCSLTQGFTSRTQGFTLIELLVVIAIISIIAGLLVPTLLTGRESAYKTQCGSGLKQIFSAAMVYSDTPKANRSFPIAKGSEPAAHDSLNVLIEHDPLLPPKLFICSSGEATPAEVEEEGEPYVLDAENLSYSWAGRRTKNTSRNRVLSSDKYVQDYEDEDGIHDGHPDGINTVKTDNSVEFIETQTLEEKFPETMLPKGLVR